VAKTNDLALSDSATSYKMRKTVLLRNTDFAITEKTIIAINYDLYK